MLTREFDRYMAAAMRISTQLNAIMEEKPADRAYWAEKVLDQVRASNLVKNAWESGLLQDQEQAETWNEQKCKDIEALASQRIEKRKG